MWHMYKSKREFKKNYEYYEYLFIEFTATDVLNSHALKKWLEVTTLSYIEKRPKSPGLTNVPEFSYNDKCHVLVYDRERLQMIGVL